MKKGTLFASILAGIAALAGSVATTPEPTTITPQQYAAISQQKDAQTTPAAPASSAIVQNLRAGATIVPLSMPGLEPHYRWAWVGRKVNGRFGYYCRRVA